MARTAGSNGARTAEAIRAAGVELIFEHGYEAVSLRNLAAAVGIQSGSLYNHIRSKQELLVTLIVQHLTDLLEAVDEALAGIDDPEEALRRFIRFHLLYHMTRKREIHIANSELRSLDPENRAKVVELRKAYEQRLRNILQKMAGGPIADTQRIRVTAFATIAMLTGAVHWYHPDGPIRPEELVDIHVDLIFNGLNLSRSTTDQVNDAAAPAAPPARRRARSG